MRTIQSSANCLTRLAAGLTVLGACLLSASLATAQQRYYPLDQTTPPGVYGNWSGYQIPVQPKRLQPVKIILPGQGKVTFFSHAGAKPLIGQSPAQAAIALGQTYRLQLSEMEEYPGVNLYPTIELVDILHPPAGKEDEFPIPVTITEEELELAVSGRLVTKVIYLEPAAEANPLLLDRQNPTMSIPPQQNVIEEADLRGRPMLILRLGSRTPVVNEDPAFFGNGAPLSPTALPRMR
ncbi:MAG: hypothetical protein HUJ26_03580 [Planctomycetaceae bacterium]|nr:hypothetical protein [Planctomycetaceae bacterium]